MVLLNVRTLRHSWEKQVPWRPRQTWKKKHFLVNSETMRVKIWRKTRVNYNKLKIATKQHKKNSPKSIFSLFWGATWYYDTIYIQFTCFGSFIGYEDGILEVISNLHVQGAKFGWKKDKFGGKSIKKLNSAEFMEFVFSKSRPRLPRSFKFLGLENFKCFNPVWQVLLKAPLKSLLKALLKALTLWHVLTGAPYCVRSC